MPSGLHRTYGAHHLHSITCSWYRRLLFLSLVRNRDGYLSILEQVWRRYRFVVVGYVVMPEHFDLLIAEPEIGNAYLLNEAGPVRVNEGWGEITFRDRGGVRDKPLTPFVPGESLRSSGRGSKSPNVGSIVPGF